MPKDAQYWVKRKEQLKSDRSSWETRWNEVAEYCAPIYADVNREYSKGADKSRRDTLCDSTAIMATNLLARSMHGIVTPPNTTWLDFSIDDFDPPKMVKEWLETSRRKVQHEFNISNFDREIQTFFKLLIVFGTAGLLFEEVNHPLMGRKVYKFTAIHPEELYLVENDKGRVDTVLREFKWSAEKIQARWPDNNSGKIAQTLEKKPDEEFTILHVVYPTDGNFNFASRYILCEENMFLDDGDKGYYTFPYLTLRWEKLRSEVYGNSPALDAIPFIRTLNEAVSIQLDMYETAINPPMMVESNALDDAVLNLSPRATNYVNDINGVKPLVDQGRWDVAEYLVQSARNEINRMFYIDQIQLPPMEGTPHTATEIQVRVEFQLRILGPMFGAHNYDFLDGLISRAFDISLRNGHFDPVPPEIPVDANVRAVYMGPLSKAQKLSQVAALERYLMVNAQMIAQAPQIAESNPEVLFMHDWPAIFKEMADAYGAPEMIFHSKKEIDQKVNELKQLQQAQVIAQMAQQGGSAVKDFATAQKMERGG